MADLTSNASNTFVGGGLADTEPVAYRRSDGVNAVLFARQGAFPSGGFFLTIVELRLDPGSTQWLGANLSDISSGTGGSFGFVQMGYIRSDKGINSVLYHSGSQLMQLSITPGPPRTSCPSSDPHCWQRTTLPTWTGGVVEWSGSTAYASSFGFNRVIYIGSDQHIHQLDDIAPNSWADLDLFAAAASTWFAPLPLARY